MCTNFTPTKRAQWVKENLQVDLPADFPEESYPGFAAPIVIQSHQSGRVACGLAKFGLIPSWAKNDKIGRHTYNARSKTAAEKPSYRDAWRQRQQQYGLVLVDNFYEPSYELGRAVRWRIELACGDPFGIACLWDRSTDPASGEQVVSFSMLTFNADEHPVMRQFHKPGDEKTHPSHHYGRNARHLARCRCRPGGRAHDLVPHARSAGHASSAKLKATLPLAVGVDQGVAHRWFEALSG